MGQGNLILYGLSNACFCSGVLTRGICHRFPTVYVSWSRLCRRVSVAFLLDPAELLLASLSLLRQWWPGAPDLMPPGLRACICVVAALLLRLPERL